MPAGTRLRRVAKWTAASISVLLLLEWPLSLDRQHNPFGDEYRPGVPIKVYMSQGSLWIKFLTGSKGTPLRRIYGLDFTIPFWFCVPALAAVAVWLSRLDRP